MSKYTDTRKLKCLDNCVKPGQLYLHPITLQLIENRKSDICPSMIHLDSNVLKYTLACDKDNKLNRIDIQRFMSIPYLNLDNNDMLKMYNIISLEDLNKWIEKQINNKYPFNYINRIINIWLKSSYQQVTDYNKLIATIYMKLIGIYWKNIKIADKEKIIESYVNKWLNEINYVDFNFNLGQDLVDYLLEKEN